MGLQVIHPGSFTTVQDRGRLGYRAWGVPVGGVFDRGSAALANALVGNEPEAATLEMTLVGGTYKAEVPLALALAGAPMSATIVGRDSKERPLLIPASFSIERGESLRIGGCSRGARTYLAVKGGWKTTAVLGSRSSETQLKPGTLLPADPGETLGRHPKDEPLICRPDEPIRVVSGPDGEGRPGLDEWLASEFRVSPETSRMGLRLEGPAYDLAPDPNRVSTPIAPGAIQLAGERLLVLGVACGTMGGYPHVSHVISADLDRIAQLRQGNRLSFRRVTLEEARICDRRERARATALFQRVAAVGGQGGSTRD